MAHSEQMLQNLTPEQSAAVSRLQRTLAELNNALAAVAGVGLEVAVDSMRADQFGQKAGQRLVNISVSLPGITI